MNTKKILQVVERSKPCMCTSRFISRYFNDKETLVVGAFINTEEYLARADLDLAETVLSRYTAPQANQNAPIEGTNADFNELCRQYGDKYSKQKIRFTVHGHDFVSIPEVLKESNYADLMLIDSDTFFNNQNLVNSEELLRDIMKNAMCPVVIVPDSFKEITNIILTHDGKPSSFYAIKQFCYLFGDVCNEEQVTLLSIIDKDVKKEQFNSQDEKLLVEYLKLHCKNLAIHKVFGEPGKSIMNAVEFTPNSLVVMGAYGRSTISMMLQASTADKVLEARKAPAFITHL